jgi:hypothetical protein
VAVALAPVVARADDEHPFKNAKVGDYATYKMTVKAGNTSLTGTMTWRVTAKSDKRATLAATLTINGMDVEAEEQVDLTKPFNPLTGSSLEKGFEGKVEKVKEGREKLSLGGKAYDTTWTAYQMKGKAEGVAIDGEVRYWWSKEVPVGFAKMELVAKADGMAMTTTVELTETGNKK